jgi:hypothetical protein
MGSRSQPSAAGFGEGSALPGFAVDRTAAPREISLPVTSRGRPFPFDASSAAGYNPLAAR